MISDNAIKEYIEMMIDSCESENGNLNDIEFGIKLGLIAALERLKVVFEANGYDLSKFRLNVNFEDKFL